MKEFIDKLIERLEEEHERCINRYGIVGGNLPAMEVKQCMEIVNELAEEYKGKSNDEWKIIYDKVCSLEKKYANGGDIESVNHCIILENLLQYFKEELQSAEEYKGGWIACKEEMPEVDGCVSDTVLVCTVDGFQHMAFWCDDEKWRYCQSGMIKEPMEWTEIIAWMPLPPAPYTEGE